MRSIYFFILVLIISCGKASLPIEPEVKYHKRQFRGVWIATVRNLDWPSRPGLSVEAMQKEYLQQLDLLKDLGMNAVIVQVRPSGDAMYDSNYEPWSQFLMGKQGHAPPGHFDPLTFMIDETHKRCMEFHAWFNPLRGIRDADTTPIAEKHVFNQNPHWFVRYGAHLYFDPGQPAVRKFCSKVIMDVVNRYDVDAIHFDDYYYPYRLEGQEFQDDASFQSFGDSYYPAQKDNWRRNNINLFVQQLSDSIQQVEPWVHFGISPFGVWRNKSQDPRGSDTETLQNNYDDLYGDALKWVEEEWIDYIIPQCYQYLGRDIMDYRVVTDWWNEHHHNVNYYIGQGPFRLGNPERGLPWTIGNEIERQLVFNDSISDLQGSAFFRSLTFRDNPMGLNEILKEKFYKFPALVPAAYQDRNRINETKLVDVSCTVTTDSIQLEWSVENPEQIRWYILYRSNDPDKSKEIIDVVPENNVCFDKKLIPEKSSSIFLTSLDKYRVESMPFEIQIQVDD